MSEVMGKKVEILKTSESGKKTKNVKGGKGVTPRLSKMKIRQNFTQETEDAINDQINMYLTSSYLYEALAWHYYYDLKGFYETFANSREIAHALAQKLMRYLVKRGGTVHLLAIREANVNKMSGLEAMEKSLMMEKHIYASLEKLHLIADKGNDSHLKFHIENKYLHKQVKWVRKLGWHVTQLNRVGPGIGEYVYDKELEGKTIHQMFKTFKYFNV